MGLVVRAIDKPRRFLALQPLAAVAPSALGTLRPPPGVLPGPKSFYGMLTAMLADGRWVLGGQGVGWWGGFFCMPWAAYRPPHHPY